MSIVSPVVLALMLAAFLAVRLLNGRIAREMILLSAGVAFCVLVLDPISLAGLSTFIAAGYGAVRLVGRYRSALVLALTVLVLIGMFWVLGEDDVRVAGLPEQLPEQLVVLGLSYVMFRVIHLVVDVAQGELNERIGPARYLGYLIFFPNFLAGPIQRYEHFAAQVDAPLPPLSDVSFKNGVGRMVGGAFALIVVAGLADQLHAESVRISTAAGPWSAAAAVSACLAYTVYLYSAFAGYMGVAIGFGRLIGMDIPENFNRPYLATNFLDFWARWHITLSEWFKFYLFNPLTKELLRAVDRPTVAPWLGAVGFFVTFFVMGLWHGTGDRFAVYGLLLGAGVSLNKAWQVALTKRMGRKPYAALCARAWYRVMARSLALSYFALALTLIWFDLDALWSLAQGLGLLGCLLAVGGVFLAVAGFVLFVEFACTIPWPIPNGLAVGVSVGMAQSAGIAYYLWVWQGYVPELVYQRF